MYNDLPSVDVERDVVILRRNPVVQPLLVLFFGLITISMAYGGWVLAIEQDERLRGSVPAMVFGLFCLLSAPYMGFFVAEMARQLFNRRPALVISPEGLELPTVKNGPVPWRSISAIRLGSHNYVHHIEIRLDKSVDRLLDLYWLGSLQRRAPWLLGPPTTISILPATLTVSVKSLRSTLEAYWKAHHIKKEPINV